MREQDWPDEARRAVWGVLYSELPKTAADDLTQSVLTALAPYVTPTAPLRDLAEGWVEEGDLCFPEKYVKELREVIDRA